MIVVGFILCWILVLVIDIVDVFLGLEWELICGIYYMYIIFGIISFVINFIIYGVMNCFYWKVYLWLFGFSWLGCVGDVMIVKEVEWMR